MISESGNANGYPWTFPKSPYPCLRDYVHFPTMIPLPKKIIVHLKVSSDYNISSIGHDDKLREEYLNSWQRQRLVWRLHYKQSHGRQEAR